MGQWTHAILYGAKKAAPKKLGEDGWYGLRKLYSADRAVCPDEPSGDGSRGFIGFWVAVGASGKDGVPDMDAPFAADDISSTPQYKASYKRAVKAWAKFAEWCTTNGISLPEPKVYIVETEVS